MNTEVVLPLDRMTLDEKLEVLNLVWVDIAKKPDEYESPEWHVEYLKKMEKAIEDGSARFIPLEEAEKIIMDRTSS